MTYKAPNENAPNKNTPSEFKKAPFEFSSMTRHKFGPNDGKWCGLIWVMDQPEQKYMKNLNEKKM